MSSENSAPDELPEAPDLRTAPQIGRRRALRTIGVALSSAAVGAAGAAGVEEYKTDHPSPTSRISPLVQAGAIGSPTSILWRGNTTKRRAAITFDDGPDPRWTPMALGLLERTRSKATFFMLGSSVSQHAAVARAVSNAGHEIGSHSWDHRHVTTQTAEELHEALIRTHSQILSTTGQTPRLMRPPYGQFDAATAWSVARMNYSIVLWSHRMTSDDPRNLAQNNINTAMPGMIVLSHDGRSTPSVDQMAAAEWMIRSMQASGWEFVTVSGLLDGLVSDR